MIFTLILILLFSMALIMVRGLSARHSFDRLLAVNSFGSVVVILLVFLSYLNEEPSFIDIALIYGLINFISTIAFLRFFYGRALRKRSKEGV